MNRDLNRDAVFNLLEKTREQIIDKIQHVTWEIRKDWTDPRYEIEEIMRLCNKLKELKDE